MELCISRHEIRLAIELDHRSAVALDDNANQTLGSVPAFELARLVQAELQRLSLKINQLNLLVSTLEEMMSSEPKMTYVFPGIKYINFSKDHSHLEPRLGLNDVLFVLLEGLFAQRKRVPRLLSELGQC